MKHDWEYKKLGEVGSFQRGKGIQKTHFVTNGMPCIHYGQIHTTFGVSTLNHISEIPQDLYEQSIIASKGDVLLALTSEDVEGSCKSTAWLGDYDVAISSDAAVFKHNLNPKFVVYYTQTKAFFIEKSKYARGFKVTHIKTSDIETIPIPVPSIEIQSLIVSELDSLSKIIADCKETLKDYDALEQSIFYDMFGDPVKNDKGWEVKKVEDIGSCCSGGTPSRSHPEYFEGDIIWYSAGELNDLYIGESIEKITESALNNSSAKLCKAGSLFVGMYDTAAFKMGIATVDSCSNQACANVTLNDNNNVIWLYFTLLFMKEEALKNRHGARQKNLNLGYIKNFNIPVPPLPLQQQFASKIEAIEKMKAETKKALQEAETLFNARMDYWFN